MRNLASIQKVLEVVPIEGADKIELAKILGWQCVCNKGDFKDGDLCVYFEIDSFLPVVPEFEFLRKSCYKNNEHMGEGFKIRTIKLRGQLSQGLALPLKALFTHTEDFREGDDVTDVLGVKKWEMPEIVTASGVIAGKKPEFIKTTDETRVQSKPELLEEFKDVPYYITTKCDGSSHSIGIDFRGDFYCTSRNMYMKESSFVTFVKEHDFEAKLRRYKEEKGLSSIVVQGEFCGVGIQKNRLGLIKPEWFVFTVDENGERVSFEELKRVAREIGAEMVPIDEVGFNLLAKYPTIEDLLKKAEGTYPNGNIREGIVIRPQEPIYSKTEGTSLSMKVINNKYLLKNEE